MENLVPPFLQGGDIPLRGHEHMEDVQLLSPQSWFPDTGVGFYSVPVSHRGLYSSRYRGSGSKPITGASQNFHDLVDGGDPHALP